MSELMSFNELQNRYIQLYKLLRNYIWEYDIVELIADLEVLTFTAFTDKEELKKALDALERAVRFTDVWKQDEQMQEQFGAFRDALDYDTAIPLKTFQGVNTV